MCSPLYFTIAYEINPWMHRENQVDQEKAIKQYDKLKKTYQTLGVEVIEIEPHISLPDMVYTANFGCMEGDMFIKSNFRYLQRRKESDLAARFLKKTLDCRISSIPDNIFFEGQGDLLKNHVRYFFGHGFRSQKEALPYLQDILPLPIIDLALTNPYFYHLDTCFAPLSQDAVIINPAAFPQESLKKIRQYFSFVIETDEKDNTHMACNLVVVGKTIVVGKGISKNLRKKCENIGFTVLEINMSEYLKGGGSIKCVSFEIN